ncbi:MAG: hypothetical protein KGZ58_08795 [Ignavibacteriales bacterium]|nr:hypothetical protein [Ignavibacteriales bacterium]
MTQTESHVQIEKQLMQLDENEQQKVFSFIQSLLNQKRTQEPSDLRELEELIAVGSGTLFDGAEEHDHYVYGTPKKQM